MITLKELITNYKSTHQALPSFNIDSFEIYQAVEVAVAQTGKPCLVQLSANEDQFIQAERLYFLVKKANLDGLPIYLNMDHGKDLVRLKKLVGLGFDMVHFDGSSLDYQTNLSQAANFVSEVKSINPHVVVEVEFNHINLVEKGVSPDSYTNPQQALEFMTGTNADLLAVSIGNLHGVNLDLPEKIDLNLFKDIVSLLPDSSFTLHGGSGIAQEDIRSAINLGIVKININTDLRLQFRKSLTSSLSQNSSEKVYDYLQPVVSDIKEIVVQKLLAFSSD